MGKRCLFCCDLKGHSDNVSVVLPEFKGKKLIFYETAHFWAIADLFPITNDPYFLIVSKYHHKAFSQINPKYGLEINNIAKNLQNFSHNRKSHIIFEHGEIFKENNIQSVNHAHSHIVFTNKNYLPYINKKLKIHKLDYSAISFSSYSTIKEIRKNIGERQNYILFKQGLSGLIIRINTQSILPSQTLRKWIWEFEHPLQKFINWKDLNEKNRQFFRKILFKLPLHSIIR